MLKSVLIANRGEIALRILRTVHRMGLKGIAVVSEADRGAPFAEAADARVEIGPGPAAQSYLAIDKILAAAKQTGADAIHPGYGFLAENPEFAAAVRAAGLTFIGPSPEAMRRLGSKAEAKAIAARANVPVVPGYPGDSQVPSTLAEQAKRLGYPVMIKAVAGGGGRGMRRVADEAEFVPQLEGARREALAAFGDGRLLIEKEVARPRHVEVQVFGDSHGGVVHLFERDCTLQRRHQKVIEEAPAPGMPPALRAKLTGAATAIARAAGYVGAGTIEFLVAGGRLLPDAPWYFIEANTRLQVEHPVTEEICGVDLVEWQLRVAAGEPLPLRQEEIRLRGHAIEARLNAEDAAKGFLPSTGRIAAFEIPPVEGLRVETGVGAGVVISPFYDSMIAKLIAHGPDRATALARLTRALETTVVAGPKTNAGFLHALLTHPAFERAEVDTGLIGRELARLAPRVSDASAVAFGVERLLAGDANLNPATPWDRRDAFQLGPAREEAVTVLVDGKPTKVELTWTEGRPVARVPGALNARKRESARIVRDRGRLYVLNAMRQITIERPSFDAEAARGEGDVGALRAPIVGRVAKLFVRIGDRIAKGDRVAVVEAMKMEHVLYAPRAGAITEVAVKEGDQVGQGALIAALGPERRAP